MYQNRHIIVVGRAYFIYMSSSDIFQIFQF